MGKRVAVDDAKRNTVLPAKQNNARIIFIGESWSKLDYPFQFKINVVIVNRLSRIMCCCGHVSKGLQNYECQWSCYSTGFK